LERQHLILRVDTERLLAAAKQRGKGGRRLCFDEEKLEIRIKKEGINNN